MNDLDKFRIRQRATERGFLKKEHIHIEKKYFNIVTDYDDLRNRGIVKKMLCYPQKWVDVEAATGWNPTKCST